MQLKMRIGLTVFALLWSLAFINPASALYKNESGKFTLTGKVETRLTFRTIDSDPKMFSYPDVEAGDVVQHRNLGYLEINQQLDRNLKYHVVGRLLYEGIYDYGPDVFQEVEPRDADRGREIYDDLISSADLWECYADLTRGPLFLRVGRQNLSWGETDLFQLLDRINPIDNTFGGIFEDLDDRRIPIWMLRATYNLGNLGPFKSCSMEGFVNPGMADQQYAPVTLIDGSPYGFPFPALPAFGIGKTVFNKPGNNYDNSRWGLRFQTVLANNFNVSLAHYRTITDTPIPTFTVNPEPDDPTLPLVLNWNYKQVSITGATVSFFEPHTDMIVRSEIAYFHDEPVFIPAMNSAGDIPYKDVFRFSLGLDKPLWIRPLNKTTMFNFSFTYFGEKYLGYNEDMRIAALRPDYTYAELDEYEEKFVFSVYTQYWNGRITPVYAMAYDPHETVWFWAPSVEFNLNPWRLTVGWSGISGGPASFGFFSDRDQASITLTLPF